MWRRLIMTSAALALIGASTASVASATEGRNGAFAFGALSGLLVGALAQSAALSHPDNIAVPPQQIYIAPPPVYYAPPPTHYLPPPLYYAPLLQVYHLVPLDGDYYDSDF